MEICFFILANDFFLLRWKSFSFISPFLCVFIEGLAFSFAVYLCCTLNDVFLVSYMKKKKRKKFNEELLNRKITFSFNICSWLCNRKCYYFLHVSPQAR